MAKDPTLDETCYSTIAAWSICKVVFALTARTHEAMSRVNPCECKMSNSKMILQFVFGIEMFVARVIKMLAEIEAFQYSNSKHSPVLVAGIWAGTCCAYFWSQQVDGSSVCR
jgi:hypothetical protein